MTTPNMEMIVSWLHNCSLDGNANEDATMKLNSEVAPLYHWEQHIDIWTGQVYYVTWVYVTGEANGTVTPAVGAVTAWHSDTSNSIGYGSSCTGEGDEHDEESDSNSDSDNIGSSNESGTFMLSAFLPTDESASGGSDTGSSNDNAGDVLVVAGCQACFMHFMVPKHADTCPKCGRVGLVYPAANGRA